MHHHLRYRIPWLVPSKQLAAPLLHETHTRYCRIPVPRLLLSDNPCGFGPPLKMPCPPCIQQIRVTQLPLHHLIIESTEMKQIQVLGNMIIMPLHPMESRPPPHRPGNHRSLSVARREMGIAALREQWAGSLDRSLHIQMLPHIYTQSRQAGLDMLPR